MAERFRLFLSSYEAIGRSDGGDVRIEQYVCGDRACPAPFLSFALSLPLLGDKKENPRQVLAGNHAAADLGPSRRCPPRRRGPRRRRCLSPVLSLSLKSHAAPRRCQRRRRGSRHAYDAHLFAREMVLSLSLITGIPLTIHANQHA